MKKVSTNKGATRQGTGEALAIEDYALIGDCETAALVGRNGSIDWLCWPHFASEACFARLLGTEANGFWCIAPSAKIRSTTRSYRDHTLILETTHRTARGVVRVTDFMPPRDRHSSIVRIVEGVRGTVKMRGELALRFGYGQSIPWVRRIPDGVRAVAGPNVVELHTSAPHRGEDFSTVSDFTIHQGETVSFTLVCGPFGDYRDRAPLVIGDPANACDRTVQFWRRWVKKITYKGPHAAMVERSLITLKALTYRPTGAVVAAPTTSLPESLGGIRNWDYRFCWLRDATFTLLAFMHGGLSNEAFEWTHWLRRTVGGEIGQLQIMYGIHGERNLPEFEIDALPGYRNSKPVHIGNAASQQIQLDVYGEVLGAFEIAFNKLNHLTEEDFSLVRAIVEHLEMQWEQPDKGIWEIRGPVRHFTYSKVMAWVAFDRAIRIAEHGSFKAPLPRWKKIRDTIHRQVCEKAFDKRRNSFMQYYGSHKFDASVLLLAHVGFLPPDDPRLAGTVDAIQRHLMEDGLVMRYRPSRATDGLPGGEGKFLACSFWLAGALQIVGREAEAHELFESLLPLANDVGLIAEEYDTGRKQLVGNFPQALSHISLVGAAARLARLPAA